MLSTRVKIALARLVQQPVVLARRALGLPPSLEARRGGVHWSLDLNEGIDFSIWLLGAFERRTVAAYSRIVGPGTVVFDIGANVGAHALPLAHRVGPTGLVFAFEPVAWAVDKLRANLRLNLDLAERVRVHQLLLSDREEGKVPPEIYASWPLDSSAEVHATLRARGLSTSGAQMATVDSFVSQAGLTRLDFIKLDVDGHECQVLRGARATLQRFRPALIVELSPHVLEEAGLSLDVLLDLLEEAGYELSDLVRGTPLPRDRAKLLSMIPSGGGINALARPRVA